MIPLSFLLATCAQGAPAAVSARDQAAPPVVIEWCQGRVRPLDELAREISTVPTAAAPTPRVVIVGRAYEGTRELVEFERDLVARAANFDVVALDVGLFEGEAADRYVRTGQGDPRALAETFGAWGWSVRETTAVLEALRARETKPAVVGIGVGSPKAPAEAALQFIEKISPSSSARAELVMAPLRSDGINGRPRYYQLSENQRGILRFGVMEIRDLLSDQRETLADMAKPAEFDRAFRVLDAVRQYEETMRFEFEPADSDPRGRILAENLVHALASRPETARALVLVRMRDLGRVGDPGTLPAQLRTLGSLEATCVATACGAATFRAYDPNDHVPGPLVTREVVAKAEQQTPFERALNAASSARSGTAAASPCWFDLRHAAVDGEVAAWLAVRRTLRSSGAWCGGAVETPWDYDTLRDFDAIVWFPQVTAGTPHEPVKAPEPGK